VLNNKIKVKQSEQP